ncbi:VCBS repeat-containing protein [Ruegeria sediminis]|uniref:VCBS repeat-containing protein n=1 Tax=Ruegeria sediminis TaxID=2583820 RepID=A0ABY2X365_9RHOB|nr:VCBS repeat-containing protein [Ruegeria sediminis]TMV09533.1 VCBS repeat-containing protein [Ruegeria sediminis]
MPRRLRQGLVRSARAAFCLWLAGAGPAAWADTIASARFTEPTARYAHGVLGDDLEWGALELTLSDGRTVTHTLPETRVFEDLAPRLADLDGDGRPEAIVVESDARTGASLAIYTARGKLTATPHIGTRFRWLAPAGWADLDGDGYTDIAYVDRPHLAKTLRIWRFRDGALTEIDSLPGLTNHRIGEDFISGGLRDCGAGPELILASADWRSIVSVRHDGGWIRRDLGPFTTAGMARALACE